MKRQVIKIDKEKCNGCGACVSACHEGAIGMVDGKAQLMRDDYCDGLGDCLPSCPTGAITFEEREALAYDEEAVKRNMAAKKQMQHGGGCPSAQSKEIKREENLPCGCPSTHSKEIKREDKLPCGCPSTNSKQINRGTEQLDSSNQPASNHTPASQLSQWPVQIKLVPVNAPYFDGANLLVAADCTAFAYGDFHNRFIKKHVTLIGCPKLDTNDYSEKLTEIIKHNNIKSISVVRMEVPCCGGIENAVKTAIINSGKMLPWQVHTVSVNGEILD